MWDWRRSTDWNDDWKRNGNHLRALRWAMLESKPAYKRFKDLALQSYVNQNSSDWEGSSYWPRLGNDWEFEKSDDAYPQPYTARERAAHKEHYDNVMLLAVRTSINAGTNPR